MGVSGQLHTYMLLRACVMGRPAEGNLAILIRPGVALASPRHSTSG